MTKVLNIAIDCRIMNSQQGIGTAVLALAKALSESEITNQQYTFIVREKLKDWLTPYIDGPCCLVAIPNPPAPKPSSLAKLKSFVSWITPLRALWHGVRSQEVPVPVSDGFVESKRFDLVHFPTQIAYLTKLPSIYQPWDLQHLHYPHFFTKEEIQARERNYRAFCREASNVCVQAEWTKRDVCQQFGLPEEKVTVIPWGAILEAYQTPSDETVRSTKEKYGLPDEFFFYPAVTWAHKNHEVIIRALAHLKAEQGIAPHVFFTGKATEHRQVLDELAKELGVLEQIHFLGFLTPEELQAVYGSATAMLFPSKFEGFGLPILEAFHARLPVLCSNATTLPEVAREAALHFSPDDAAELAKLMHTVLKQPDVRSFLIDKGAQVLAQYSIKDMAQSFQSLYEKVASQASHAHPTERLASATST